MGLIHRLNSHLTNMIAAGEVVERPMGVVKELVENAIDAQATSIDVQIVEGGLSSITIKDNGIGMDSEDATLAFQRHSTSKIAKEEDLWAISSLGFRGEALPSIASVSECTCVTSNGTQSTKVKIHYGQLVEAIPYDCERGTTIEVVGLFLKTPARLKHMKSLPYEQALIVDVMQKFAMSYPEISFSLKIDQKEVISTNGSNNIKEVVYRVYGSEVARESIEFEDIDQDFKISGLLVKPVVSRATRKDIHLFMNKRMVKSTKIHRAISDGYKQFLPSDRYPIVFLFVDVDLKLIDVNVHPSKWEVRLSKEFQLLKLIEKSISDALTNTPQVNRVRAISVSTSDQTKHETVSLFEQPFMVREQADDFRNIDEIQNNQNYRVNKSESFTVVAQLHKKYILAENEEGLFIFDQHASMERIRYEYFKERMLEITHHQQDLLVPITITSKRAIMQMSDLIMELDKFQIKVEQLQEDTLIIRSIPRWLTNTDEQKAIDDIVDYFENEQNKTEEDLRRKILASLACHSSIRFNDALSVDQMQKLVNDLMLCEQPYHCPHGRPTFIKLTVNDLSKEFKR
jgi:DNA mismatch repair protein MutL